jgi:hypothetical protein
MGLWAGVTRDMKEQAYWNLGALDWDRVTTRPSLRKLESLGFSDIAEEYYPSAESH